jgi:hypothetical protein
MAQKLPLNGPAGVSTDEIYRADLARLRSPSALISRLRDIDTHSRFRRLYIMGCGRSGTWLLTAVIGTLQSADVVMHEVPVEAFGQLITTSQLLVLKRDPRAYLTVESIPDCIEIVWIVRHPFDVLTSSNAMTLSKYHISPGRWIGEMTSLQYLMETRRPLFKLFRYEDLVERPEEGQQAIASWIGLPIAKAISEVHKNPNISEAAIKAMHGLRPIDNLSVGKFRNDPERLAYLSAIYPRIRRHAEWIADQFGYDIKL